MDSKNVIWLSSFFALLFITFCVTKNLDALNPHIVNITNHNTTTNYDNNIVGDIQTLAIPKVTTSKLTNALPQKEDFEPVEITEKPTSQEAPSKEKKFEIPVAIEEKIDVDSKEEENISSIISTPKKEISATNTPKPVTKQIAKVHTNKVEKKTKVKIIPSTKKSTSKNNPYIIDSTTISPPLIENSNDVNRIAYKYVINQNAKVLIMSSNISSATLLKRYLETQNVKKDDITIEKTDTDTNLISIKLIGRD